MALEIWYDQEPDDDFHEGDPAIVVNTAEELETFIDRVVAAGRGAVAPPMIEVSIAGVQDSPVMQVGLGQERGFIAYLATDGGWTAGDASRQDFVPYDYMGSVQEVPASAEVPTSEVRKGLRAFLETERRPEVVH
ncbi:MAG TPA: Imm1 family immunity protein [Pseudonocardiaceae bacterium]|jgi:hypothetical protein|nr:Imm1 family immunity protein [Pseudonocardiaceae bacterium]